MPAANKFTHGCVAGCAAAAVVAFNTGALERPVRSLRLRIRFRCRNCGAVSTAVSRQRSGYTMGGGRRRLRWFCGTTPRGTRRSPRTLRRRISGCRQTLPVLADHRAYSYKNRIPYFGLAVATYAPPRLPPAGSTISCHAHVADIPYALTTMGDGGLAQYKRYRPTLC